MKNKILLATNVILMAVVFVGLFGCKRDESSLKYKQGDIVYLKPDSIKAVIIRINKTSFDEEYMVRTEGKDTWYDDNQRYVFERTIYGK